MKFLLSKKKIFYIFFLSLIFLFILILFSFNYLRTKNQDQGLIRLKDYCNSIEKGKKCILLLQGDYFQEDNRCFSARLPIVNKDNRNEELYFCLSNDLVTWYNPYLDYESFVPVSIIQKKDNVLSFFNRNYNKKIEMQVIDDSEVKDLYENIRYAPKEKIIGIYSKENFDIKNKGYYASPQFNASNEIEFYLLSISKSQLISYTIEDSIIHLTMRYILNNTYYQNTFSSSSFLYIGGSSKSEEIIITPKNIHDYLTNGDSFNIYLKNQNNPLLNKDGIEDEVKNLQNNNKDDDFIVNAIIKIEDFE